MQAADSFDDSIFHFLQTIVMTGQKVGKVLENAFGGLKALEALVMNNNAIRSIPNINNVKSTLKSLNLQGNEISEISENYFKGFKQLKHLHLDDNQLHVLPNMSWLKTSLHIASFRRNHLISLNGLTLGGYYAKLNIIRASYNDITYFNSSSLLAMPSLIMIALTANQLVHIADVRPYYNGVIHLDENPWRCDHSLSWMHDFNLQYPAVCCSPSCLRGRDLSSLRKLLTLCGTTTLRWRHNGHGCVLNNQPAIVYSTVYSGADQRKHQSSASLAFVRGIHRDRWIPRTKGQ